MRTLLPHADLHDVALRPAAVAMAWLGVGQPHETIAVPGVALACGDALVAVELSTINDSDVRAVQGVRRAPTPLVLGHESVGRVIAIGDAGVRGVDGSELRVGDRVVWSTTITCGDCDRCAAGFTQLCRSGARYGHERIEPRWELTGGFASHVHLRSGTAIVRVPEALPAAVLAPAGATAAAWAAVARAAAGRILAESRVLVLGAELVGLAAAAIAAEQGADVTVVDSSASGRARALRFELAVAERPSGPADVVIEAGGRAAADSIDLADVGGIVVLIGGGAPLEDMVLDAEAVVRRMVTVAGVDEYTGSDLSAAVAFLAGRGRAYPFAEAVGVVHPLSEIDAALAAASAPDAPLRVGLAPR